MDRCFLNQGYAVSVMDTCSYCEIAMDGVRQSIDLGDYDGAFVKLSAYLLEIHRRWIEGQVNAEMWRETLRFYRRMTLSICNEMQSTD